MNNVLLEKGIIHLMLPFRCISGNNGAGVLENNTWTRVSEDSKRYDFLLEHVKEFFTRNNNVPRPDESACLILRLKKDALPVKLFNNRVYWISNRPLDGSKSSDRVFRFRVYIDPASFGIIYYPFAGIGTLIYCVELKKKEAGESSPALSDFIKLNYLLRIFCRQDEAFMISQNDRPEERGKALQLLDCKYPSMFDNTEDNDIALKGWRPSHLINWLLCEINNKSAVEFFNPCHIIPFSYFQPSESINNERIVLEALFYLRNVYDFDYAPPDSISQSDEYALHPFRQIYYAASIEGAVILNNSGEKDPEFIKTFYSNSFKNSLWVMILGLMQRTIFLQLLKEVSDVDPDDHRKIKEYLRRYTSISLKALFSKISVYHQHNDFYDLIIQKLQINELQTELKDELTELNNLQRQFHEDEVERHEIVEKQYEKRLNFILFALSVLSLAQITYTILGNESMPLFKHLIAIGIPLGLGIIIWEILRIRKNLNKQE